MEIEEMPRRGCYKDATTARITAWAAPLAIYVSGAERISLPPTEYDRRGLPGAGCLWTLWLETSSTRPAPRLFHKAGKRSQTWNPGFPEFLCMK